MFFEFCTKTKKLVFVQVLLKIARVKLWAECIITSLVCGAVFLWIHNEDLSTVSDWPEELLLLSSSDLHEAMRDPSIFLVYSNDHSAGQGSDSADASNFLQRSGSLALAFLCLFCCLLPQTDNWFVLISWASFPDDSSALFGSLALWGNAFFRFPALLWVMLVKVEGPVWASRLRVVAHDSRWERFIRYSFFKRNNNVFSWAEAGKRCAVAPLRSIWPSSTVL